MLHDPNEFGGFAKTITRLLVAAIKIAGPSLGQNRVTFLVAFVMGFVLLFSAFVVWSSERVAIAILDALSKVLVIHPELGAKPAHVALIVGLLVTGAMSFLALARRIGKDNRRERGGIVITIKPRPRKRDRNDGGGEARHVA